MDDDRYTRITLRIPRDLHSRLSDEADRSSKSLNAEIIARLSASFEPHADAGALQQQLEVVAKSLRLHEDAMTIMHGFLNALLLEIPEDRENSLVVKMARSFKNAPTLADARAAWDSLAESGDASVLLHQRTPD